jgi:hypothetical protein
MVSRRQREESDMSLLTLRRAWGEERVENRSGHSR